MTGLVQVLGAGIIGLSVAEELIRRGHRVHVHDPAPERATSYVAAGMLGPASETWYGETEIWSLGRRSLALWPQYAARLGVDLHATGTLLLGRDAGDRQQLERHRTLLSGLDGTDVTPLDRRTLAELEPGVLPGAAGLRLSGELSVDPRAVLRELHARIPVSPVPAADAEVTVVATGAHVPTLAGDGPTAAPRLSAALAGLSDWIRAVGAVRPVRGEIVRVRTDDPPRHTLRAWVRGETVYLVPRTDGTGDVLIGATSEEHDEPARVTVDGVWRLLATAAEIYPAVQQATFVEARAGDRPGTPDNLPLIGRWDEDVVLALGHFRHGVLLAPLTATLVADHLETDHLQADHLQAGAEPSVDPSRFRRSSEGHSRERGNHVMTRGA